MSGASSTKPHAPAILACSTFLASTLLIACESEQPVAPLASPEAAGAQADVISETPEWIGNLLNGSTHLTADGSSTQEELPGMGHKFELLFAMMDDQDPQNPTNDVISVTTAATVIGVAVRNLPPGIKITAFENQLNLKYFFPARSCAGGSPRIQIAIDRDGDGTFDGNAFGYVGHAPFGTGCITAEWDIIDMTDQIGRWDLSQLEGGMTMTWDQAETFVTTTYPEHRVLSGSLVDDSCGFAAGSCGEAYYDLVTVENRTLENDQDTVGGK
ncbi:MAG: hypothetical protein ACRELD_13640 [Longimicrobiales bacterium]